MSSTYSVNPDDFVMKLNNFLQAHGALNSLTWIESASGPAHGPEWTITASTSYSLLTAPLASLSSIIVVDGVEYGWGSHRTKQGARHEAARKTLHALDIIEGTEDGFGR
ncbi:hypothetical protein RSOLAG1IB_06574 [Rhizoctonia solani AG-1 IB]|uniref:DRBM domain-containing protein n=1 Tax=Thanatephorus cucumeris (strain AG1-IB / isolate 7/3/14) TaxID=1108050 RepID=A0A0B7FC58_THACB|nr:hypothetical protein RSOLAG1IB_06574 [Rhizoctonia solani AG-1 IB]